MIFRLGRSALGPHIKWTERKQLFSADFIDEITRYDIRCSAE